MMHSCGDRLWKVEAPAFLFEASAIENRIWLRYEYFSSKPDRKFDALIAGIEGLNMLMRKLRYATAGFSVLLPLANLWSVRFGMSDKHPPLIWVGPLFLAFSKNDWGPILARNLDSAYLCPLLAAKNFKLVAEWATAVSHPWRARCLLQLGNIFKIQAVEIANIGCIYEIHVNSY